MSFLYFFPGRETPLTKNNFSDADKAVGLDAVLRDAQLANLQTFKGPDDGAGYLAMIDRPEFPSTNLAFDPIKQTWQRVSDHHWLGWWNDHRPTAELLQRPKTIDGEWLEIEGQRWLIPVCGPIRVGLPTTFKLNGELDKDGRRKWKEVVSNEYDPLMRRSEEIYRELQSSESDAQIAANSYLNHVGFCADVLKVNYHLGDDEIDALEIIKSGSFIAILRAAFGWITYEREAERAKQVAVTGTTG